MGNANAAVFPDPVWANPMMSLPSSAYGMHSRWISDGCLKPSWAQAVQSSGRRPRSANEVDEVGSVERSGRALDEDDDDGPGWADEEEVGWGAGEGERDPLADDPASEPLILSRVQSQQERVEAKSG